MPTLPSASKQQVRVTRKRRQGVTQSPFTGKAKVYDWNAPAWRVEVTLPPMKEGDAAIAAWIQFFEDCNGMANTFTMDISRYAPGQSGLTAVSFRLDSPDYGYEFPRNLVTQFSFSATEDL